MDCAFVGGACVLLDLSTPTTDAAEEPAFALDKSHKKSKKTKRKLEEGQDSQGAHLDSKMGFRNCVESR